MRNNGKPASWDAIRNFRIRPLGAVGGLLVLSLAAVLLAALPVLDTAHSDGGMEIPAQPTGLEVDTEAGSLDVSVEWVDVDGADEYWVRWRMSGPGQKLNDGVRPTSSDTQITVADYGKWVVRVQGCNEAGCGKPVAKHFRVEPAPEPTPEPTPLPEPPVRPTGLQVNVEAGSLVVLTDWDEVDRADEYLVRWRLEGSGNALNEGVRPTSSEVNFTVADYGRWMVQVAACNGAGCGPAEEQTVKVTPGQPWNLAVNGTPGSFDLLATWDVVAGADSYRVNWRLWGEEFEAGNLVSVTETAAATVSGYGQWVAEVQACNGEICGPWASRIKTVTPAQPTNLVVSVAPGSLNVSATWDAVDGVAAYSVEWKRVDRDLQMRNLTSTTDTTAAISVSEDGRWMVKIRACHTGYCGPDISQTVDIRQAIPTIPQNLVISATPAALDLSATWDAVAGAESYLVEWRRPGGDFETGNLEDTSGTSASVAVGDYGRWVVRVRACRGETCGPGAYGSVDITPAQPTNLAVEAAAGRLSLAATWDAVAGADVYLVQWRWFDGDFAAADRVETAETSVSIAVASHGRWVVRVLACSGGVCAAGVSTTASVEPIPDVLPVCDRTPEVRDAIVGLVPEVSDCSDVTEEHLKSITGVLSLARQSISTLQSGDFHGLTALNGLNLHDNWLTSLPTGLFRDLNAASWVRLSQNRLTEVDENAFSGLQNLGALNLDSNNLKTIPSELFAAHTILHTITLDNNELTTITAGAFDDLVNIHTLRLDRNKMTGLPAGLFHDLRALRNLQLDGAVNPRVCGRPIEEIEELLKLLPQEGLMCLQVTDGDIVALNPTAGVCDRTPAVRTAIVSKVPGVYDCESVTDAHLAAITGEIYLSYKGLTALKRGDLAGLSNLKGLSLRYNRLTGLPNGAFDDLAALIWLKIDNNRLADLPAGIFSNLDNLKTLWLNNNRLSTVPPTVFDGLDTLTVLYMYSNAFTTLPAGLFEDLTSMERHLWLDHAATPHLCGRPQEEQNAILERLPNISNCKLATDGDVSLALATMPRKPVCERTPVVKDAIVAMIHEVTDCAQVTESHLAAVYGTLNLENKEISELQVGDFDGFTSLSVLNLQNNRLTSLPAGLFKDLGSASSVQLNNNLLTTLDEDTFSGMDNLQSVTLSDNKLKTIPVGLFYGRINVQTISLNNNQLTSIPSGAFDGLTSLKALHLHGNMLTTLPARLFADLTGITTLLRDDVVNPGLCELSQSEQEAVLGRLPDISDCRLVTDTDVDSLSRPNVILIMADDLGYGDLGSYGQSEIKTPELDAMAAAGMRFTDFYSGHTLCPPSRETLMTGRHTGHTAIRGGKRGTDQRFCDSRTTIGQMMQSAGYRTAVIGKWGLGGESTPAQPNDQGFDYFYGYLEHVHAHNSYPDVLFRNREQVKLANVLQRPRTFATGGLAKYRGTVEFSPDLFMEEALNFIEGTSATGQPFFLYLPLIAPHANSSGTGFGTGIMENPPNGFGQYADKPWTNAHKSYAALVSDMDEGIGRLLERLDELKIGSNTVTFFTSDNGPHNEGGVSRNHFRSAGPLSGGKRSLKEGGIRAPLVVHWPGSITAGTVSDHVSAAWDLMPTLAQIADVPAPEDVDGISMLPTLSSEGQQTSHPYLYWNWIWHSTSGPVSEKAVRYGHWKAIHSNWSDMRLFNLNNDPGEMHNVAGANPEVVRKIEEIIAEAHVHPSNVRSGSCYIE